MNIQVGVQAGVTTDDTPCPLGCWPAWVTALGRGLAAGSPGGKETLAARCSDQNSDSTAVSRPAGGAQVQPEQEELLSPMKRNRKPVFKSLSQITDRARAGGSTRMLQVRLPHRWLQT